MTNYFELYKLPVSFRPDQSAVKSKFYALSRQHHPDKYAAGDAAAMMAIMSGEVTMAFATIVAAMPQIKSGRVKTIGIASKTRTASLPDVPTISASGLTDFESASWGGVLAPAGTPSAIVASLHREFAQILRMTDVNEKISSLGADIIGSNPAEFTDYLKAEIAKWSGVIKSAGVNID